MRLWTCGQRTSAGRRRSVCIKEDNVKDKIRTYDFWMAIASALFVVLQAVGFSTEIPYLQEITTAFLGFLAVSGFIVKPPAGQTQEVQDKTEETLAADNAEQSQGVAEIIDKIIDNTKK